MPIADYLGLMRDGLPKTPQPLDVLIVGMGLAGLHAGYVLLRSAAAINAGSLA